MTILGTDRRVNYETRCEWPCFEGSSSGSLCDHCGIHGTEELYRVIRIARVQGFIHARDNKVLNYISHLYDGKGVLHVYWEIVPSDAHKELVDAAWGSCNEYQVEHIIPDIRYGSVPETHTF